MLPVIVVMQDMCGREPCDLGAPHSEGHSNWSVLNKDYRLWTMDNRLGIKLGMGLA